VIRSRKPVLGTATVILVLIVGMPFPAATQTVRELQRKLDERDAIIADLLRRVEALERHASAAPASGEPSKSASPPASAETAADRPSIPAPQGSAAPSRPMKPAPGQFTVDEETAERALERALVQTGALLLDPGRAEIQPNFFYIHGEGQGRPIRFADDNLPETLKTRSDRLEAGLTLRFGLPFSSQVEFSLPYASERQSEFVTGTVENSRHASGLGDFSTTLSKVLLRESSWRPDLTADIRWDSNTGKSESGIDIGSGFNELTASLWAVKRVDPLALIGSISYTNAFERDDTSPGDSFGVSLGTVLATSPDTSLRFTLNQGFTKKLELDGRKVPGTDVVDSTLSIGGSIIFGSGTLLDIQADIGLTSNAPDYAFRVSLPISFDLPIPSGF
jgi:hypothetical protein